MCNKKNVESGVKHHKAIPNQSNVFIKVTRTCVFVFHDFLCTRVVMLTNSII
jgi:hypothetical protein